jgi:hypothetical protein
MKTTAAGVIAVMLFSLPSSAQTLRGDVGGTVTDQSGKAIAGAMVTLTHLEAGRLRRAESDSRGEFLFTLLAPGDYLLDVESASYQSRPGNSLSSPIRSFGSRSHSFLA